MIPWFHTLGVDLFIAARFANRFRFQIGIAVGASLVGFLFGIFQAYGLWEYLWGRIKRVSKSRRPAIPTETVAASVLPMMAVLIR
jgi:flagellar motor component MotA